MQGWNDLEPEEPQGWAAPAPPSTPPTPPALPAEGRTPRRRMTRTAIVSAAAAVVLVVAGVSIAVAQTSSTSTPSTSVPANGAPGAPGGPGGPGGPGYGRHGMKGGPMGPMGFGRFGGFGMGGVIHGEFVRPNGSGGYQTVDIQNGQVTDVSSSSITLKSPDGFSKTYSVTTNTVVDDGRDGIGNVKTGDRALVEAVVNGSTAEAKSINDLTNLASIRQHWNPNAPNTPPSTSPTTSA